MILDELMRLLRKVKKVHPEAGKADVTASSFSENVKFGISFVGYKAKSKHKRGEIELEN